MVTNLKKHYCDRMPPMAAITYSKKNYYIAIPELATTGFTLELSERKKEGKLEPKRYNIKVPINYCPFCGDKLEAKPHLESCDCMLCETEKAFRGTPYET